MKQFRVAVILAGVILILGGLATWDEWKTKKDEEADKLKNRVVELNANDVIEIDFVSQPGNDDVDVKADPSAKAVEVTAVKKDGVWRLTKPVDAPADGGAIEGLVKTVTEFTYTKEVATGRDKWADFGLEDTARRITLRVGGDKPGAVAVYIGKRAPVGYNVYVRTDRDERVLLGSQHLLVSSAKSLFDFRDKSIAKVDEKGIKTLSYQSKGEPPIELVRTDDKWAITKPETLEGDAVAVRDFVEDLSGLRATAFVDGPSDKLQAAFADPDATVTWANDKGESSQMSFATSDDKLYATFNPKQLVFALGEEVRAKIKKATIDFRNRRIFSAVDLDAASLEIDGELYRNVVGAWYASADADKLDETGKPKTGGEEKPQEKAHLRALLVDLEFAKTDAFLAASDPAAVASTSAPEHRLTFRAKDQSKEPLVVEFFKENASGDRLLVRRTGSAQIYRVQKAVLTSLTPPKPGEAGQPATGPAPIEEEEMPMDDPPLGDAAGALPSDNQDVSATAGGDHPR